MAQHVTMMMTAARSPALSFPATSGEETGTVLSLQNEEGRRKRQTGAVQ